MEIRSRKDGSHYPIVKQTTMADFLALQKQEDARKAIVQQVTHDEDLPSSPEQVQEWIAKKAKEYGGKNRFLASEEYKHAYPTILAKYREGQEALAAKGKEAMKEVGAEFGDRMVYTTTNPFGMIFWYTGTLTEKDGLPYVKVDDTNDPEVKKSGWKRWHKGWKKGQQTPHREVIPEVEKANKQLNAERLRKIRHDVRIAKLTESTVPYSLGTLLEAGFSLDTIRKVWRGKQ